jgi:hypothetical protein
MKFCSNVENTLRNRPRALLPAKLTGPLPPIFKEDEWKRILVGAVLGLLLGINRAMFLT